MDGLKEDAEVLFVLTTNRPEALEAALTARPGRIDQAIEFPLPDAEGRRKLVALYGRGMRLGEAMVEEIVKRTEKVSAAFIKELMRRAVQFHLEKQETSGQDGEIELGDVQEALEEMMFRGGALNVKLLGGERGHRAMSNDQ
jgi:ATP-dependent 26S proteasome regulatory subunit